MTCDIVMLYYVFLNLTRIFILLTYEHKIKLFKF